MKTKKIVILGGGTFSPIRNHFSLASPAFGTTAKQLKTMFSDELFTRADAKGEANGFQNGLYPKFGFTEDNVDNPFDLATPLVLTKMADSRSDLVTNGDVSKYIDTLIDDEDVGTIILNVAFCDFDAKIDDRGFHGERLKTANGDFNLELTPSAKIVDKIRRKRPDIFLVGFKTTTNANNETQFLTALKMMKRSKCNLVLANDTVTRHNMIITPEEVKYEAGGREEVLLDLVRMVLDRNNLTYSRTNFIKTDTNIDLVEAPENFRKVMEFLVANGGYIENNGNGFTPGHFCFKLGKNTFASSQRKVNHNNVFRQGMTKVTVDDGEFTAEGTHKPSVGSRSQWLMMNMYPEYDCVVHTHNPLKSKSLIPVASQREFQCGSLECGMNTLNNLDNFDNGVKAVMLDKHGSNIIFKSTTDSDKIIEFIKENIELGVKTT